MRDQQKRYEIVRVLAQAGPGDHQLHPPWFTMLCLPLVYNDNTHSDENIDNSNANTALPISG